MHSNLYEHDTSIKRDVDKSAQFMTSKLDYVFYIYKSPPKYK